MNSCSCHGSADWPPKPVKYHTFGELAWCSCRNPAPLCDAYQRFFRRSFVNPNGLAFDAHPVSMNVPPYTRYPSIVYWNLPEGDD